MSKVNDSHIPLMHQQPEYSATGTPPKNVSEQQLECGGSDLYDIEENNPNVITEDEAGRKKKLRSAIFLQIRMFLMMVVIDIGLPLALYYILKMYISQLLALIISGIPPLLHVIIMFIIKKRIEVIGCICVFSFILSAVLSVISGDVRVALLRDSTTMAVLSLAFLITMIPIRTKWFSLYPMTYLIAHQLMSQLPPFQWTDEYGTQHSLNPPEFYWTHCRFFRIHSYVCTALWGSGLMAEFIAKVIMIEATTLTVDDIVLYGSIAFMVLMSCLAIFSVIASVRLRKRCARFTMEWMKINNYVSK